MTWFKIAFRNILNNRRRSLTTILAIGLGFCAVNLFFGYAQNTYRGIIRGIVHGQGVGHLTVFKEGYSNKGKLHPEKYLFSEVQLRRITELTLKQPHVRLVTPRLYLSGLVSNGNVSTIFLSQGVVPAEDIVLRSGFRPTEISLDDKEPAGAQFAEGLAAILDLKVGSTAVVMTSTVHGMVNALDVEVKALFNTGVESTNDKIINMTLQHTQRLYDTDGADRMVILLDDIEQTGNMQKVIADVLTGAGLQVEVKNWEELSSIYAQIRNTLDMTFLFIFLIVLVIVIMGIINTMTMSVMERVREIGTLRALGLKRSGVKKLFSTEGALLGFFGCCLGLILVMIAYVLITYLHISFVPPGGTMPVILGLVLVPGFMAFFFILLIVLALLAAYLPARRAARATIVDALGHI